MLNLKLISKILGSLLWIEGLLLLNCLAVSLWYQSVDVMPFVWSILITVGTGFLFRLLGRNADNLLGRRDAYFVVTVAWILFTLFGTLPFMISGYIHSFTDAFFEAMSGFTTTGATIIDYPERLPKGLLYWRSLTQWIGGLGIVFFTIAILPSIVGFATESGSIMTFHSPAEEYVCSLFCFLSGVNFTLMYASAVGMDIRKLLKNSEFRFYALMVLSFALFIAFELVYRNHYDIEHAFRSAIFQVVSFITTTGLVSDDAGKWPHVTWVVVAACMFFGGCSGSTSGGIKSIRGVMLLKVIRNEFRQILHPNAVLPMKIDGVNIPQSKRVTLLGFIGLYLVLTLFCSFTMIAFGIDNTNAITITLSSLGNVGPTLGMEIGPTMSWAQLPDIAKWICSFLMLVGRLELFTVLVLFTPAFWKEN